MPGEGDKSTRLLTQIRDQLAALRVDLSPSPSTPSDGELRLLQEPGTARRRDRMSRRRTRNI